MRKTKDGSTKMGHFAKLLRMKCSCRRRPYRPYRVYFCSFTDTKDPWAAWSSPPSSRPRWPSSGWPGPKHRNAPCGLRQDLLRGRHPRLLHGRAELSGDVHHARSYSGSCLQHVLLLLILLFLLGFGISPSRWSKILTLVMYNVECCLLPETSWETELHSQRCCDICGRATVVRAINCAQSSSVQWETIWPCSVHVNFCPFSLPFCCTSFPTSQFRPKEPTSPRRGHLWGCPGSHKSEAVSPRDWSLPPQKSSEDINKKDFEKGAFRLLSKLQPSCFIQSLIANS